MTKEMEDKIQLLRSELKSWIRERDEEIDGLLTALLSRHHILLIGPRGTAKSLLIRLLAASITDARYWERLFTKHTVPEEVFGAVKLSALKEDKYERAVEGHLPTAHLAFIDEIWKSNSAILNSLLTLINERKYHNDGGAIDCPLETLMGASNELPGDDALNALFDRFVLRYKLKYIEEDSAFKDMLRMSEPRVKCHLTFDELHMAQSEAASVQIPDNILNVVVEIRKQLKKEGIIPSDRRYREVLKVIRAYAYINGRKQASTDDLSILRHCLWDDPTHIATVERIVIATSNPMQRNADEMMDAIQSALKSIQDAKDNNKIAQASEALAKINKARTQLADLKKRMETEGRDTARIQEYMKKAEKIVMDITKEYLGISI